MSNTRRSCSAPLCPCHIPVQNVLLLPSSPHRSGPSTSHRRPADGTLTAYSLLNVTAEDPTVVVGSQELAISLGFPRTAVTACPPQSLAQASSWDREGASSSRLAVYQHGTGHVNAASLDQAN
ncbi:unnamed protein product [Boreogadus saida]